MSGEATYLFLHGLYPADPLCRRIYRVTAGADLLGLCAATAIRELFIVPVWRRSWWQGAFSVGPAGICFWRKTGGDIGRQPCRAGRDVRLFPVVGIYDPHRFRSVWRA